MRLKLYSTIVPLLLCVTSVRAAEGKDPRLVTISKIELQQLIAQTPIESTKHATLTARSYTSNLQKLAYDEYTKVWKNFPNNTYANLRRGIAALNYWRFGAFAQGTSRLNPQEQSDLYLTTRTCLAKSVELTPRSAQALVAYGFFLWQYDNQMDKGLALLKKAQTIAPHDPRVHANLGAVYCNHSGNAFDLGKAEGELRTAIKLERTWAYPYVLLISVYLQKKNYKQAQWAANEYSKLGKASDIKIYQNAIDRGLGKA